MTTGGFNVVQRQTDTEYEEEINEKFLMLENKMKVMLIDKSCGFGSLQVSVALDVYIGNFFDLKDFPGLAYLCQRMLILGNNIDSEPNGFQKLVNKHNGYMFLTTLSDHTTYYFHIYTKKESVLEEILHRFAQIFISTPSFEEAWIEEEIKNMDTKLEVELQNNWFQYFERSTVTSDHPYSNYGLGKKKILTELSMEQIKFKMLNFILTYYCANNMTLCIASSFAPDKVEEMVTRIFSKIKNLEVKIPEYSEDPFKDQLCTQWYIAPKNNYAKNLRLSFVLPNEEEDFWRTAVNCISFFLECNNEKSLLDILKAKNWCNSISTSACQEARNLNFFHVLITLLPEGYSHIHDIILLFFEYLKLFKIKYLQSENKKLQLHKILNNMLKCGRLIEKEKEAFTQQSIVKKAQQLHTCPMKNIVNQHARQFYYIVAVIEMLIYNYISPLNIRVYIINNDLTRLAKKWDNADYTVHKIPKLVIDRWTKLEEPLELLLPDLEFVPHPDTPLYSEKIPKVIKDTLFTQLWYAHATPQSSAIQQQTKMFFHFISPHVYENPMNINLNFIFAELVKDAINRLEFLKDELQLQIERTNYGILLEVTGYVPITYYGHLSNIIENIINIKVVPEQFNTLKNNCVKTLKSFASMQPSQQACCYLSNLLSEKSWPYDEVLKTNASTDVTIDKMQEFIQKFVNDVYVKCFIYGEINESQALEIGDVLKFDLTFLYSSKVSMTRTKLLQHREIKLENGIHVLYEAENKFHDVSCTLVCYQIGRETMDLSSNLELIHYIMTRSWSNYFKNIRHINKVHVNLSRANGVQKLEIEIESFRDHYVVEYHIKKFISYTMNHIKRLSTKEFEKYKTDFIRHLKIQKYNQISDVLWIEIFTALYCFDPQKVKFIQDIEQESLYMFYKENIYDKDATVSVHVSPKCENKLQKENASQSEEEDQSELSDKSNASNKPKPEISVEIHKPLVSAAAPKMSFGATKVKKGGTSTFSSYKKTEKWMDKFYHLPETRFKKINDIMLFKQTQNHNYYD